VALTEAIIVNRYDAAVALLLPLVLLLAGHPRRWAWPLVALAAAVARRSR